MTPLDKLNTIIRLVGPGVTVGGDKGDLNDLSTYEWAEGITPPTEEEIEAEFKAQEYSRNREIEYPNVIDQLDFIYHNGIEKWKTDMIDPVKDKYPKG